MNRIPYFDAALIKAQAARILKVWKANREFRMKDATIVDFARAQDEFERILKDIAAKNRELDELRKARARAAAKLDQLCSRAQSGMRGYFGPNSLQHEQTRGDPPVKRTRVRKAKPTAAAGGESTGMEQ